jgi:hypothetical protein
LFFTTGDISADGWQLLETSGVIGMDGLMLSAFICDQDIAINGGNFEPVEFNEWVDSHLRSENPA